MFMRFPSKIDGWLIPVMVVSFAGLLVALIAVMITPTPWFFRGLVTAVLILLTVLVFSIFRSTYYLVTATDLRVVSGPFRWTIALSDITGVTPTRNPLSSPALSLDRLKVSYGERKFVLISPEDKAGFIKAIGAATKADE